MRQATFGKVILLSDHSPPKDLAEGIEWRKIGRLASRSDYSSFMLRELVDHIETPYALCVQWDGFVLRGVAWDPHFLDYDYVGAIWPQFRDGLNVGNGGFSLRSRRLLRACKALPVDGIEAEDILICRTYRRRLEELGLRFAPDTVARKFSYERTMPTGKEFGFHGSFNLVRIQPAGRTLEMFRNLEPHVLARSENLELLRWAISRRRIRLAIALLARLA